jgi:hypothetical protein
MRERGNGFSILYVAVELLHLKEENEKNQHTVGILGGRFSS